jgi:glycosyltransferase involved in cell wall biosynthesis
VLPYTEGSQTGIISIEATFKKPVIATNVGNFAEMVLDGETGLIVPPKDSDALAQAIITLLKDEHLRRQMGENAYLIMNERFSRKTIADKLNEIYQDLTKTGLY